MSLNVFDLTTLRSSVDPHPPLLFLLAAFSRVSCVRSRPTHVNQLEIQVWTTVCVYVLAQRQMRLLSLFGKQLVPLTLCHQWLATVSAKMNI